MSTIPSYRDQMLADIMTVRVFLVEDNQVIRESLAAAMEELAPIQIVGFADDEPTATTWIASNPDVADLLVVDMFLRRGSGLDVLRAAARMTRACTVVLSNYATPEIRRKCLELGATRVFDKSTEIDALVAFCAQLDGGDRTLGH